MSKSGRSAAVKTAAAVLPIAISTVAMVAVLAATRSTRHNRTALAQIRQDVTQLGEQVSALRINSAIHEIAGLAGNLRGPSAKIIPLQHRGVADRSVRAR